jgi:GNAT superfamily N-acetyltransferase
VANHADRLQDFLRTSAANGRTVVEVAPFHAFLDPGDDLRYLNYAVPQSAGPFPRASIDALRAAFHAYGRLPRLEWVDEAAPDLEQALAAAGMTQELRTPLMTCDAQGITFPALPDGATVAPTADADLRATADVQRVAFDQPPVPEDADPPDARRRGGGAVLARVGATPAAAATWTAVIDATSEVAGVATAEPFRRRGLAGAVTAAAAREAFAAGASLCVISPGGDDAQRVYARAGFRRAATILHWSDPS